MYKRKKKKKWLIFVLLIIIGLGVYVYFNFDEIKDRIIPEEKYFPLLEDTIGKVDVFTRYGRYFNISGNLDGIYTDVYDVKLVLNNKDGDSEYKLNYIIGTNNIVFSTNEKINEGIILDGINIGEYYILLKIIYTDETYKYYSLENASNYENIDYYTMTKNNKNNYITIDFKKENKGSKEKTEEQSIPVFKIKVVEKELPSEIYDIVIDPGHGGIDPGAVNGHIHESKLVLGIALDLKDEFEKLGYKVMLTRTGDYDPGTKKMDPYSEGGRAITPNDAKAKYLFSIHLNSDYYPVSKGGVEMYIAPNMDTTLAKLFADRIVQYANTNLSPKDSYKVLEGVYIRGFLKGELRSMENDAKKYGYTMYNITEDTPYYYMLRETGGIITGAYVDGRNSFYSRNKYYDVNFGVESYIFELGYIINNVDLKNIQDNKNGYIKGIIEAFKEGI
ncbi:MAG: N-acetylmuramoyl-L-alanine amidase [Bacilli bacterium]